MKNSILYLLLITTFYCNAVTYTTDGVDSWDVNGAPPAGWLAAGTIINVGHSISNNTGYTAQLNGAVTVNITSGGTWTNTGMSTNGTGWDVNIDAGGTWDLSGTITTTTTGDITVSSGGTMTCSSINLAASVTMTVDGSFTSSSSTVAGAGVVMTIGSTGEYHTLSSFNLGAGTIALEGYLSIGSSWTSSGTVTGSGVMSYATGVSTGIAGTITLPVELIYFDLLQSDNLKTLIWKTASEINNDYFEIQRSKDGIRFETIGNVTGSGNSYEIITYSFNVDDEVFYYRLKQVDFDGEFEYSHIIISGNNEVNTEIVQKGTSNEMFILFNKSGIQELKVIDINGKLITSNSIEANEGDRFNFTINQQGLYVIYLTTSDGLLSKKVFIK